MNAIVLLVVLAYLVGMPVWVYRLQRQLKEHRAVSTELFDAVDDSLTDLEYSVAELERQPVPVRDVYPTVCFYRSFKL